MKALSLTQPWAFIVLRLGKCIENRSRNLGNYRRTLALHASKRMTSEDYFRATCFVAERFGMELADRIPRFDSPELVRGAVLGVCEVVNQCGPGGQWIDPMPLTPRQLKASMRVGAINANEGLRAERKHALARAVPPGLPAALAEQRAADSDAIDMRWYMGEHGYLLEDQRELTAPIPCKGALGFWTMPPDVERVVRGWMNREGFEHG